MWACPWPKIDLPYFQSTLPSQAHKLSTSFRKLVHSYNLYDTWRVKHPPHKQYTFFSPPHKLYSRLDHFFVTAPLLPYVVTSEINPITWSDHAPINLDIILSAPKPRTCHWHLNECLLRNPESQNLLQQKLFEFFQINEGSVLEVSTLWEAHKAFFRGECISAGSRLKRDAVKLKAELTSQLRAAETSLLHSPPR